MNEVKDNINERLTIRYYDDRGESYAAQTLNVDVDAGMEGVRQDFLSMIPEKGFILDCGCGAGRDTLAFSKAGYPVLPLDGSAEMCRITEKYTGIKAVHKCFEDIDYEDMFDGIWASASLLHVARDELRDVLRKLRTAGKRNCALFMSFKYGDFDGIRDDRYYTDLNERNLDGVLENTGWKLDKYVITGDKLGRSELRWLNIFCWAE